MLVGERRDNLIPVNLISVVYNQATGFAIVVNIHWLHACRKQKQNCFFKRKGCRSLDGNAALNKCSC